MREDTEKSLDDTESSYCIHWDLSWFSSENENVFSRFINYRYCYVHKNLGKCILYKQPHFRVESRVTIKLPKMRLKVALKLLYFFQNRGLRLLKFWQFSVKCKKSKQNWAFCCDFRKSETRRVENAVAYKKCVIMGVKTRLIAFLHHTWIERWSGTGQNLQGTKARFGNNF